MKPHPYGPAYVPLLGISALAALGAVLTLVPSPGASWPNILGYKSLCTFAPAATFACALVAAAVCTFRARFVKRSAAPRFVPIAVIALLALGFAVSTFLWAGEKAKYSPSGTDAVTTATSGGQ